MSSFPICYQVFLFFRLIFIVASVLLFLDLFLIAWFLPCIEIVCLQVFAFTSFLPKFHLHGSGISFSFSLQANQIQIYNNLILIPLFPVMVSNNAKLQIFDNIFLPMYLKIPIFFLYTWIIYQWVLMSISLFLFLSLSFTLFLFPFLFRLIVLSLLFFQLWRDLI